MSEGESRSSHPEIRILDSPQRKPRYTFVEDDSNSLYSNDPSEFSFVQNYSDPNNKPLNNSSSASNIHTLSGLSASPFLKSRESVIQQPQSAPIIDTYDEKYNMENYDQPMTQYNGIKNGDSTTAALPSTPPPLPSSSISGSFNDLPSNEQKPKKSRKLLWVLLAIVLILAIASAVLIPVGLLVIKKHSKNNSSDTTTSSSGSSSTISTDIPESAQGTILDPSTWLSTTDLNTTYTNATVGGLSIMGLNSTWNDSTRANSNVPRLDEKWEYGKRPIRGVNIGGWLILEPYINPSFFGNVSNPKSTVSAIVDEYTLTTYLNETSGSETVKNTLENHYNSWVNEDTFREIAAAGLDHIRIPVGYWALKTYPGDPYLAQVAWRYLLRGIEWARKYGLRINLDVHGVPGSQNGWNHSGRQGWPYWLNETENGQLYGNRSLELHSQLGKFFAQDRYKNIVQLYTLVNEPKCQELNVTLVTEWTKKAYDIVRSEGYNNTIVYHDGFLGAAFWQGVFPADKYPNMAIDLHEYMIFDKNLIQFTHNAKINFVCINWAEVISQAANATTGQGPTIVGEWSQADNDCTFNLNDLNVGSRWEGTYNPGYGSEAIFEPSCPGNVNCTCEPSNQDPSTYSAAYKQFLRQYAELQMEMFEGNGAWGQFYWTWKTENITSSQWSYKDGMKAGMLPELAYERIYNCSAVAADAPNYNALGLPETY